MAAPEHTHTGNTDALIEQLASAVHARRMTVPAILFLEAHKPLTSLFHTAAVMSLPMMLPLFGGEGAGVAGVPAVARQRRALDPAHRGARGGRGPLMPGFENATPGVLVIMALMIGRCSTTSVWRGTGETCTCGAWPGWTPSTRPPAGRRSWGVPLLLYRHHQREPVLYACLGVLHYVARKAARYKSRLLLPQNNPEVMAIAEDVLRDAYRAEGRSAQFDPRNIRFLSEEQFAFAAATSAWCSGSGWPGPFSSAISPPSR